MIRTITPKNILSHFLNIIMSNLCSNSFDIPTEHCSCRNIVTHLFWQYVNLHTVAHMIQYAMVMYSRV